MWTIVRTARSNLVSLHFWFWCAVFFVFCGDQIRAVEVRGFWRTLAAMPAARQEVGVAELEGKIYVIGGLANGAGSARVDVYDIAQNGWQAGPALPTALHHVAAASVGGKVYCLGGFSGSTPVNTVLAWDPSAPNWSMRASLPTARAALAAAVMDGKIYAVGGSASTGNSRELAVYDSASDTWSVLAPMPTARNHHAAAALGGKLYVVGGRSPNLSTLEEFDPASGTWQSRASMPTARSGIAAATAAGFLFVFGGEIPGVFQENEVYDPTTDSWFALEPMAVPRHGIGAAVVGNRIIIPGGATLQGVGATNVNDEFVVLSEVTAFAQFGEGRDITSQIVLTNAQSEQLNTLLELRDDSGAELTLNLGGKVSAKFQQSLGPRGTEILTTPGSSVSLLVGGALLFSDRPLLANILFATAAGFAGVPGQKPGRNFLVSVQRQKASGVDSGIAIANVSPRPNAVTLVLRDKSGADVASKQVNLAPYGHVSKLLAEIFDSVSLDAFQGSLAGSAQQDITAMAILLRPNQMATLPVQISATPF